jgi:hypothetical protein
MLGRDRNEGHWGSEVWMGRFLRILWAYVRCNVYLMFRGCWKGEREFTLSCGPENGPYRLALIAASTGKIDDPKFTRFFWIDEELIDGEHLQRVCKGTDDGLR